MIHEFRLPAIECTCEHMDYAHESEGDRFGACLAGGWLNQCKCPGFTAKEAA